MGNQCRRAVQADRPAFTGIDLLALFIGVSTLLAGVIGIGNIMWVIVKRADLGNRHTPQQSEPNREILSCGILSEGAALAPISGLAGLCMAAAVLGIMHKINNPPDAVSVAHFQMSFSQALMILATFIALGTSPD